MEPLTNGLHYTRVKRLASGIPVDYDTKFQLHSDQKLIIISGIVPGSQAHQIFLLSMQTGRIIKKILAHSAHINQILFLSGLNTIISCSNDATILVSKPFGRKKEIEPTRFNLRSKVYCILAIQDESKGKNLVLCGGAFTGVWCTELQPKGSKKLILDSGKNVVMLHFLKNMLLCFNYQDSSIDCYEWNLKSRLMTVQGKLRYAILNSITPITENLLFLHYEGHVAEILKIGAGDTELIERSKKSFEAKGAIFSSGSGIINVTDNNQIKSLKIIDCNEIEEESQPMSLNPPMGVIPYCVSSINELVFIKTYQSEIAIFKLMK